MCIYKKKKKDMFMRMQRGGMDPSKGQDKAKKEIKNLIGLFLILIAARQYVPPLNTSVQHPI